MVFKFHYTYIDFQFNHSREFVYNPKLELVHHKAVVFYKLAFELATVTGFHTLFCIAVISVSCSCAAYTPVTCHLGPGDFTVSDGNV